MNPRISTACFALFGLVAVACRDDFSRVVARNDSDQALWLRSVFAAEVQTPASGPAPSLSRLLDRIAIVPGVERTAVVDILPGALEWDQQQIHLQRVGVPPHLGGIAFQRTVSPGYFATMELHLLLGRYFAESDGEATPLVAIVNESYAEQNQDQTGTLRSPLGQRIKITSDPGPWLTIVGIVQDGPRMWNTPEVYVR